MTYKAEYLGPDQAPTREALDSTSGPVLVEFGTAWCGFCQAAAPDLESLLERNPGIEHVKVEDGQGRRLGRTFKVKLWPSLVFMRDGAVVRQLARPDRPALEEAFAAVQAG